PLTFTDNNVVYVFSTPNNTTHDSKLTIWTAAKGVVQLSAHALLAFPATDGTNIAWVDNGSGNTADIVVASVDGTGKQVLKQGVNFNSANGGCTPGLRMGGTHLAAAFCNGFGDAGAPDAGPDAGAQTPPAAVSTWASPFTAA